MSKKLQSRIENLETHCEKANDGKSLLPLCIEWPPDKGGQEVARSKMRRAESMGQMFFLNPVDGAELPEGLPCLEKIIEEFV